MDFFAGPIRRSEASSTVYYANLEMRFPRRVINGFLKIEMRVSAREYKNMRVYADGHFEPHRHIYKYSAQISRRDYFFNRSHKQQRKTARWPLKQNKSPLAPHASLLGVGGWEKTSARRAVWCMQFFARSTPRVNNASSSSDNEHRKKYFCLYTAWPALSYCILRSAHVLIQIHLEQNARNSNAYTPIL